MNRFIEALEKLTGKKVIRPRGVSVSHDGRTPMGELRSLAMDLIRSKWYGVKYIKNMKKLGFVTTNDLDDKNKLRPDYLERRAKRNEKKKESKSFGWSGDDWR